MPDRWRHIAAVNDGHLTLATNYRIWSLPLRVGVTRSHWEVSIGPWCLTWMGNLHG